MVSKNAVRDAVFKDLLLLFLCECGCFSNLLLTLDERPLFLLFLKSLKNCNRSAEATSCRAAIRTARAVVQDLGASSASKSPGLNELAKISEQNSERDVHTLTSKKFLLSIPIELTTIPKPPGIRYSGDFHAIRLRDWCRFLVDYGCWHVLVGLSRANPVREQAILREFWRRYRLWRPDHQIWRLVDCGAVDLSRTAPMILHGDEGRGFKRGAFLVAAYHSYIGRGTNLANTLRKHRSYLQMRLNYSGSSWSHRFLSTCLPKMCADTVALESLLNFMTQDALDILHKPVLDSMGNKYSMAVLQVSGDWQFLAKAGNLLRSFSTVQKKPRPDMSGAKGICHWCLAGREHVPFEDFRVTAAWRATQFLPGDQFFTSVPALLRLLHEENKPARLFMYDLWHSWHLGLGKTFLGSALALLSQCMEGGNIDLRFQNLTNIFLQWAEDEGETPYISALTKEMLQWPDLKSFPNGNWNKGHVTSTLLKFLVCFLESRPNLHQGDALLSKVLEGAQCINEALRGLYSHDLWLSQREARQIGNLGQRHMEIYQELATLCFHQQRALFIYMPKSHVCSHIFLDLATCETEWCISPLAHAVQVDEDMVGKVSRLSRRVSPMQVIKRVLQRGLHATFAHFVDCGYLQSH